MLNIFFPKMNFISKASIKGCLVSHNLSFIIYLWLKLIFTAKYTVEGADRPIQGCNEWIEIITNFKNSIWENQTIMLVITRVI